LVAVLGVIRVEVKICEQQRLAAWLRATTLRLDRDKDSVNLGDRLCVVELQNPALLVRVIFVEEAQTDGVLPIGAAAAPGLESASLLDAGLLVEVVSVENERFVFGIEDPPEGLLCIARLRDIVDFGNVQVAGANQIPDVAVAIEQLPLPADRLVFVFYLCFQIVDLRFECE
jgi:hypothetical protein